MIKIAYDDRRNEMFDRLFGGLLCPAVLRCWLVSVLFGGVGGGGQIPSRISMREVMREQVHFTRSFLLQI